METDSPEGCGKEIRVGSRSAPVMPYGTHLRIQRTRRETVQVVGGGAGHLLSPLPRSSKTAFRGKLFSVRVDQVRLANKIREREVVVHPGAVAIVALTPEGKVVLVRQYRHPVGASLWELPAGTLGRKEKPLAAAQRELAEETGYEAEEWKPLGEFYTSPGFCTEKIALYLARGLKSGPAAPEEDEELEIRAVPWEEALDWAVQGKIKDAKTLVGLLLAQRLGEDIAG